MKRSEKMQRHISDLRKFLADRGWEPDRFGHMKQTRTLPNGETRTYRYKFGPGSLRKEVRVVHGHGPASWVRLYSAAYGQIKITENGKLSGLKR